MLYLRLDDGRTAVYGHVCRFENARLHLEDCLLRACEKSGTSFPGNVYPDPAPRVKRGETVAYSGDLGVGGPHLHFEIRRGERLCDPLLEGLQLPAGAGPPVLLGLAFLPRTFESSVDGTFEPCFVKAVKGKKGYRLTRPVAIAGEVEIEAVGGDNLGLSNHTTGIPILSANVGGRRIFSMNLRCISLARFKQSPALFDRGQRRRGAMAYRLRRLPGMEVAGISGEGLPGGMKPGIHKITVTASDRTGDEVILSGLLRLTKSKARTRLALPGSKYRLKKAKLIGPGLLLLLHRASKRGVTPVSFGERPVLALRVSVERGGEVRALIAADELPEKGAELALAGKATGWLGARGPGAIGAEGFELSLPRGLLGMAEIAEAKAPSAGVRCLLWRPPLGSPATLSFAGIKPGHGLGLYRNGKFVANWKGPAVPVRRGGRFTLKMDLSAPRWGVIRVVSIPNLHAPELIVTLSDLGSGPNLRTLKLTMDGLPCFADWDPDTHEVRVDLSRLKPGRHFLSGSCSDFAGNSAVLPKSGFSIR